MIPPTINAIEKKSIREKYGDKSTQYKIAKTETEKLMRKDKLNQIEKQCDEVS